MTSVSIFYYSVHLLFIFSRIVLPFTPEEVGYELLALLRGTISLVAIIYHGVPLPMIDEV